MTTLMFPGQGSQYRGMGEGLFAEFPAYVQKANDILGYSIVDLCLNDPEKQLYDTYYIQPALYVINALAYYKWLKIQAKPPDFIIGHSLGEYSALLAAQVFDFETGLRLVQQRAQLMSEVQDGGMAAIVGLRTEAVHRILHEEKLPRVVIANYNTYTQFTISGPIGAVLESEFIFINNGALLFLPLKVKGAFHSLYMKVAQERFTNIIRSYSFSAPKTVVISNVDAKPYQRYNIRLNLALHMTHAVLWRQSIEHLLAQGETEFIEMGPGKVLTGMVNRIRKNQ